MELQLPKPVPMQIWRDADPNIPPTAEDRRAINMLAKQYVEETRLTPPMPIPELRTHARAIIEKHGLPMAFENFIGILVNNAAWEDTLAGIPYERRLLLMPKCLRKEAVCPAPFDEFGLLCKSCGQCSLQDLQVEAERLGYAVLIAEGSALVMSIIETGKIEAIVGVSCLSVLERAFPYMEAAAIPGVAIPLLQGDCIDTNVDLDWIWDVIHLTGEDRTRRMDLDAMREDVKTWFTPESLEKIMGPAKNNTEVIAREWLGRDGKRWRPFLAACVLQALQDDPEAKTPDAFKKVAVAVECFHKASLIHDDIEDNDALRYGQETLHEQHGVPIALNAGDLLIGEGYRLIAESGASPSAIAKMITIAAEGQRALCQGQGDELDWTANPEPLNAQQVVGIFARKTAPAFEVALRLGAAYAEADDDIHDVLTEYSNALGIAYQVRDDLHDAADDAEAGDIEALRPSILLALANQKAKRDDAVFLERIWRRDPPEGDWRAEVKALYEKLEVTERVENLLDSYKETAVTSLKFLDNPNLKGLLRRVIGKIFDELEIKGWCKEYEARNEDRPEPVAIEVPEPITV